MEFWKELRLGSVEAIRGVQTDWTGKVNMTPSSPHIDRRVRPGSVQFSSVKACACMDGPQYRYMPSGT